MNKFNEYIQLEGFERVSILIEMIHSRLGDSWFEDGQVCTEDLHKSIYDKKLQNYLQQHLKLYRNYINILALGNLKMIRHKNRIKSKKAKKAYHYCGCDRNMISPGQRCEMCGKISLKGKRKFKKDVDLDLEEVL